MPNERLPKMGDTLDPARVEAIAAMLPDAPFCFGKPATDREAWKAIGESSAFQKVFEDAEEGLEQDPQVISDELFLEFSQNGNRTHWQEANAARNRYLTPMVLAECIEHKGRFIHAIERLIDAICSERTWVMPAHDARLTNFHKTAVYIDLASSAMAWSLACVDYLLGDELTAATRERIRDEVQWRVFDPFREIQAGERDGNWWMTGTNNWNSVCLASVLGAALYLIEDKSERAWYVVASEEYVKYFLAGFAADGYCSEGVGYWCYGFGRFMLMVEEIWQATGGRLDLLTNDRARKAALYGAHIEVFEGMSPPFADCSPTARPAVLIMYWVSKRLGLGLERWEKIDPVQPWDSLFNTLMTCFPNAATEAASAEKPADEMGLRDWFPEGQVYLGRPAGSSARLGVALKGGHNAEHHNHNDLGSYAVFVGDSMLAADPGGEIYTRRTFSPQRYESDVLNSFGHSVPRIAGKLQETGREAQATVVSTDFTDKADTLVFDLKGGYDVPTLQSLERTFVYSREGEGSLTVTDRATFSEPTEFETAVMTIAEWKETREGVYEFRDGEDAVRVTIEADGPIAIESVEIKEDVHTKRPPVRLGVRFAAPVTEATVTVRVEGV